MRVFFNVLGIVCFFALAVGVQSRVAQVPKKENFLSPPENLKYFTLGYNDMLTSSMWIRLLQDFEYCENGKHTAEDFVGPVEGEKDSVNRILKRKLHQSKCDRGWVYKMLNAITDIDPHFKLAYDTGAVFLSIIVDDREGARLMYEKGLTYYPNDWDLNFQAAYHYLWEMNDPEKAAIYFDRASKMGGPPWIVALSAALFTKVGKAQFAKVILLDALAKRPTGFGADRIKIRLAEVEKILQEKP